MNPLRPILGITMGDPAGIGPEISAKALAHRRIYEICRPVIVGDARVIRDALAIVGMDFPVHAVEGVSACGFQYGTVDVYDLKNVDMGGLQKGRLSQMAGRAAFESVREVIKLAMESQVDATVTGPLNKEAMNLAGYHFSGHTEIYAHYTGAKDYAMMLVCDGLRVVHVSTHVSLREACDAVKQERVFRVIGLADEACRSFGIARPHIGVAGLNPHAGENGLFGREEITEIRPAVVRAVSAGIRAEGPLSPDSIFSKADGGMYDAVVAMYHDQGHIPLKLKGFRWSGPQKQWTSVRGVNITLGLPIIRTSVDHGTAFEEAGRGTANEESLVDSIELAARLAVSRLARK